MTGSSAVVTVVTVDHQVPPPRIWLVGWLVFIRLDPITCRALKVPPPKVVSKSFLSGSSWFSWGQRRDVTCCMMGIMRGGARIVGVLTEDGCGIMSGRWLSRHPSSFPGLQCIAVGALRLRILTCAWCWELTDEAFDVVIEACRWVCRPLGRCPPPARNGVPSGPLSLQPAMLLWWWWWWFDQHDSATFLRCRQSKQLSH